MNDFKKKSSKFLFWLFFGWMISLFSLHADADIEGKVTLSNSIHGINKIKISLQGPFSQEVLTDQTGFFQFKNVPSGIYMVEAELPFGYVAACKNPIQVTVNDANVRLKFPLGIPSTLAGRVIAKKTFLPVENAQIDIMRGPMVYATTYTDHNGTYALSDLIPWNCSVRVTAENMRKSFQIISLRSEETMQLNFLLDTLPSAITGVVRNLATNEPIPHASIHMYGNGLLIDCVESDETGFYSFEDVFPNSYELKAMHESFLFDLQNVLTQSKESASVDFALKPYGRVEGTVVHAFTGEPMIGAVIGMWQNDALCAQTKTDEKGSFSLPGLGSYHLLIQAHQFHDLVEPVEISSYETSEIHVSLVCIEPLPITRARIKVSFKQMHHFINRIHCIQWIASRDKSVVLYRIYHKGKCIAEVSSTDPLTYYDQWCSKKNKTYLITTVNAYGQESKPLTITVE